MIVALAQINPVVGDLPGNAQKISDFARRAADGGADLVVFPELSVTGYPPLDLLFSEPFLDGVEASVGQIARDAPDHIGLIIGAPVRNHQPVGKRLYNAALLVAGGDIREEIHKSLLPTYDVYDEYRYFEPAHERSCITWQGKRLGVLICEDMWNVEEGLSFRMYAGNPLDDLVGDGAEILISVSATPFALGKRDRRTRLIRTICDRYGVPLAMVNQVGANTDLIFDGGSSVHGPDGRRIVAAPTFEEALILWDTEAQVRAEAESKGRTEAEVQEEVETKIKGQAGANANTQAGVRGRTEMAREASRDLHDALVLGIRDYFWKTGSFTGVVIGLSGGIDSAVTCALAVEALGAERVHGVTMPSEYSSAASVEDSSLLAQNLGIRLDRIPIQDAFHVFREMLADVFDGAEIDATEENIQARARGVALMALANKFGYLLLSTGNKSETAVGYATLYGDMAGGLAVLSDVFKTHVYELAAFINEQAGRDVIPRRTIEKAPSAELRPGQTDQDTLPPYEVLDEILRLYVEESLGIDAIADQTGHDRELVGGTLRMVDRHEYKRQQAPPGLRVSIKAFGSGRRLPIVARVWHTQAPLDSPVAK